MKSLKIKIHLFACEALQFTLITYLILMLTETFKEGFVTYFFNIHIMLGVIAALGATIIITYQKDEQYPTRRKLQFIDILFSILLASVGSILIYDRTNMLGPISFAIVGLCGLAIMFFSLLLLSDTSKK